MIHVFVKNDTESTKTIVARYCARARVQYFNFAQSIRRLVLFSFCVLFPLALIRALSVLSLNNDQIHFAIISGHNIELPAYTA